MLSIVIVFPKLEDANAIKTLLVKNGYEVQAVCTSGAQAIGIANELDGGIVVSGYRMPDMLYREIAAYLPKGFELLLLISAARLHDVSGDNIIAVSTPLKTCDFLDTVQMMMRRAMYRRKRARQAAPRGRSEAQKAIIEKAKLVLMQRNNMTEEEAYRYLQKNSMDSGTNMVEMAEMVLSML